MSSAKAQVRDHFRKEILAFSKGQDLKKKWKIKRLVTYNGVPYENKQGLKTKDSSGMWKMGWTIRPYEDGYLMMHWTVVSGVVEWNAEIRFNKKMTPLSGFINSFMGSPMVCNGEEISKQYLLPYINEGGTSITKEAGFTFSC
tara:strand:+ start:48 stop:476 length:429 start_codon:yes stop_codon:yes gene_type:complete